MRKDLHFESQELSGLGKRSYNGDRKRWSENALSDFLNFISVPEPSIEKESSRFVYNYFVPDERLNAEATSLLPMTKNERERSPRGAHVKFIPPRLAGIEKSNKSFSSVSIQDINIEGGLLSDNFVSISLADTNKDSVLHDTIKLLKAVDTNISGIDRFVETGDKSILSKILRNIQSEGSRYASTDISKNEYRAGKKSLSIVPIHLSVNRSEINTLLSSRMGDSIYLEEFNSAKNTIAEESSRIQHSFSLKKIQSNYVRATARNGIYPRISFGGYIVQKYEIIDRSRSELVSTTILETDRRDFFDTSVRYGSAYFYRIRALYEVDMLEVSDSDNALLRVPVVNKILIASRGDSIVIDCSEKIEPPVPASIRLSYSFKDRIPHITWSFPLNKQRDIKKFQIFRRFSVSEPFVIIGEIDFDDSIVKSNFPESALSSVITKTRHPRTSFFDVSYRDGNPIYAVSSVDAHGFTSNYSSQIKLIISENQRRFKTERISDEGAPKPYPNLFLNDEEISKRMIVGSVKNLKIFFTPDFYKIKRDNRDLKFIKFDSKRSYVLDMIDMTTQKSKKINIKVIDATTERTELENFADSSSNINFEFPY